MTTLQSTRSTVPTPDGRSLDVYTGGPEHGIPLLFQSGTPSAGIPFPPFLDQLAERGMRYVAFSRPGYGSSTRRSGRSVADVVADVATVLDQVGADRVYTIGWSGGGPHALATAALLQARVAAVATIGGIAPYPAEGLDYLAGMGEENIEEFEAALAGPEQLIPFKERAAPIFRELDLACDIWLVHLTGEEFPADCLGARHLCQRIVEEKLDIAGVFVLDMVAHNNRHARDIFQICPGWGKDAMLLARTAHETNVAWNEHASVMNGRGARKKALRGKRSKDPRVVPPLAKHLRLSGDVRPPSDSHSTLYNTDGQIFSDTGIPVVLFMENYDINRRGYHDSHDTMENIDLDYGAALVAIAIETVARTAGAALIAPSASPR